jgi:tetraacyldisaccharide 4'-kinase
MWLYTGVVMFRNFLFDKKILRSSEFDLPLIVVGNLRVGGTGKTPHVDYLIRILKQEFKVATLSRGYGRKTHGFREVTIQNKSHESGDESLQIKYKYPQIPVFVGENRVEAITQLLYDHEEIQCVVLDDAFQHRALKAGFNIVLSEYAKLYVDDKMLPLGRLREPIKGIERADCIIVTKCPDYFREIDKNLTIKKLNLTKEIPVFFSSIKNGRLYPLSGHENVVHPYLVEEVLLVCGIANPTPLISYLEENYESVETLIFKDHHRFNSADIQKIMHKFKAIACKNKIIITTEKDAIRLKDLDSTPGWEKMPIYVLPIEVEFRGNDGEMFNELIKKYVRKNN